MPVRSIAEAARWVIDRDARLRRDLFDAGFATPSRPTVSEWDAYWRRNPIRALTGSGRSRTTTWFTLDDDRLTLDVDLPEHLRGTAHEMVRELVEHRLHRYLVGRATKRAEEKRRPRDTAGRQLDATFSIEHEADAPIALFYESAGGTRGSGNARNVDYVDGLDQVLVRMRNTRLTIEGAYVASTRTSDLPIPDRRLDPGEGLTYPIDLTQVDDLVALRRSLLRSMASVGRQPGVRSGGNSRKAMRLVFSAADGWSARDLADALAGMKSDLNRLGATVSGDG